MINIPLAFIDKNYFYALRQARASRAAAEELRATTLAQ
jgi:hypothetical protein